MTTLAFPQVLSSEIEISGRNLNTYSLCVIVLTYEKAQFLDQVRHISKQESFVAQFRVITSSQSPVFFIQAFRNATVSFPKFSQLILTIIVQVGSPSLSPGYCKTVFHDGIPCLLLVWTREPLIRYASLGVNVVDGLWLFYLNIISFWGRCILFVQSLVAVNIPS
jgi:hypothetical protein